MKQREAVEEMNRHALGTAVGMGSKEAQKQLKQITNKTDYQERARSMPASASVPLFKRIPDAKK